MPTDTRYTAALATAYDARGVPTMAQSATLCGHKPPTVTDTTPPTPEAVTMDSSANTHRPNDAERTLYRNGRTAEAVQMYRERVGGRDYTYCWNAFADDRDHAFSRAEAAARIVRCAREWASGGTHGDKGKAGELLDACDAYERLIEASE